ncbi:MULTISPECIES: alpha/beta hydrolase [unclassified Leifsonia]|uniref:alpha/beta hydrolase n=1 Tax=unclassified Leifsonia TaxID=2663824 RepID=UPI0006FE6993|nr:MULTISPECIES: alpha/beta hydrolase-fold protein [unclassified Leifsonia]KQX08531.1 phospholipase [Leifsonia sp. Root1293]KRA12816.1 phospholipase [Leifsonia sp. Root60]
MTEESAEGSLQVDDRAVLWSASAADRAGRPLLVLLHGYGSHEGDLFGLAPYLPLEPVLASVRAPIAMGPGNAWFPLHDSPTGFTSTPADISAATDALLDWIDGLEVTPSSVGLLGFSQGGAMALELLRARPEAFAYAAVLAGFVADLPNANDSALAEAAPPVFWGRGTADAVIASDRIDRTQAWLPTHSTLTERIYEGLGHSVSEAELGDLTTFLRARYV